MFRLYLYKAVHKISNLTTQRGVRMVMCGCCAVACCAWQRSEQQLRGGGGLALILRVATVLSAQGCGALLAQQQLCGVHSMSSFGWAAPVSASCFDKSSVASEIARSQHAGAAAMRFRAKVFATAIRANSNCVLGNQLILCASRASIVAVVLLVNNSTAKRV